MQITVQNMTNHDKKFINCIHLQLWTLDLKDKMTEIDKDKHKVQWNRITLIQYATFQYEKCCFINITLLKYHITLNFL